MRATALLLILQQSIMQTNAESTPMVHYHMNQNTSLSSSFRTIIIPKQKKKAFLVLSNWRACVQEKKGTKIRPSEEGARLLAKQFYSSQLMSKYKTLIAASHRESLEQSIGRRLLDNSLNRRTIDSSLQQPLMSTNKSIIYIKLPKKNHSNLSNFRASLYEASLKRLKQQHAAHQKDFKIPKIPTKKKKFEEFQEEVLRQYNLEKVLSRKLLPNVYSPSPSQKIPKEKSDLTAFLDQKSIEEEEQQHYVSKERERTFVRQQTLNADKKPFFIEHQDSIFGYRNLKQKYLSSKQNSLASRKNNQMVGDKYQSRSSLAEQHDTIPKLSPYKSKEIEQHMNRYNQRDLFQTKLTGFKTNIHPVDRSLKFRPSVRDDPQANEADFSNFVKRKKLKSTAIYLNRMDTEQRRVKLRQEHSKQSQNPNRFADCSPWETELTRFD